MTKVKVKIPEYHMEIEAEKGENLLKVLSEEGVFVYSPCGGLKNCGKCRVRIEGNAEPAQFEERELLGAEKMEKGIRLACKTRLQGHITVHLVKEEGYNYDEAKQRGHRYRMDSLLQRQSLQHQRVEGACSLVEEISFGSRAVLSHQTLIELSNRLNLKKPLVAILYDDEVIDLNTDEIYGVAIDFGTTTVTAYLINLVTGYEKGTLSLPNPQRVFGSDVISRIHFSIESEMYREQFKILGRKAVDECLRGLAEKTGISSHQIYYCVMVSNTAMNHLYWGFNTKSLGQKPFLSLTNEGITEDAKALRLQEMNESGKFSTLPGIAGFVGSDTVGAIIGSGFLYNDQPGLLIDLGTNGEIVLRANGRYYVCSTAAGPAFEGANIYHGMQAFDGAINHCTINEDLNCSTIGNEPAKGICGSGLVSITAELLKCGMVQKTGKISTRDEIKTESLKKRILTKGRKRSIRLVEEDAESLQEEILLIQSDIRELQLAKAAIKAGIELLIDTAGISPEDIKEVIFTGAFGNYLDINSAKEIMLFPTMKNATICSVNNAAGEGAKRALCQKSVWKEEIPKILEKTIHVEISEHERFQETFVASMSF